MIVAATGTGLQVRQSPSRSRAALGHLKRQSIAGTKSVSAQESCAQGSSSWNDLRSASSQLYRSSSFSKPARFRFKLGEPFGQLLPNACRAPTRVDDAYQFAEKAAKGKSCGSTSPRLPAPRQRGFYDLLSLNA